jgi:NAD(P)-dependent dehydrogenase (short-subunit alcohol dehydrogenase family)
LYTTVQQQHGHIDVVFANAGLIEPALLGEISEATFDKIFAVNVKGLLFTVQKALPFLGEGSSIILTASSTTRKVQAAISVYAASKAAIRSFARTWTLDLQGRNIRVNAISPGPTRTPGVNGLARTEEEWQQLSAAVAATVPLGRMADPDEIAKAVVFLASDESSYVNGIELFVDGGQAQI